MSFKILVEAKSLCVVINPLLTGPVWSRWLYINFVLNLRLHGPRLRLAKNRTRPVPSHLDLTVGQLRIFIYLRESHVDQVKPALQSLGDHHPATARRTHGSQQMHALLNNSERTDVNELQWFTSKSSY